MEIIEKLQVKYPILFSQGFHENRGTQHNFDIFIFTIFRYLNLEKLLKNHKNDVLNIPRTRCDF